MIDDVLISALKDKHDSAPRRTKVYKMRRKRIEKYLIYGLIDPISLMVRYVGLSSSGMERPKSHTQPCLRAAATHCGAWIRSLALQGLVPLITVLEKCPKEVLSEQECWWIAFGRALGWPLTNLTNGGERTTHTAELRAKMSATRKGKPRKAHTAETRAKMSAARKGRPGKSPSAETRAKTSAANMGKLSGDRNPAKRPEVRAKISLSSIGIKRLRTAEHNAKIAAAHLGFKHTAETKARMREKALKRPSMSAETRAKCSAASRRRWSLVKGPYVHPAALIKD